MSKGTGVFKRVMWAIQNKTSFQRYLEGFNSGADMDTPDSDMMKYSAVFACVRVLAETFASVTVHEYKKTGEDRKKTNDTGYLDLLKNAPNGYMSAYNYHEMSSVQLNTDGNFYALKDKDSTGRVTALKPIISSTVTPEVIEGQIKYKVGENTYSREDVFHLVGFSPDGLQGYSPLEYFSGITGVGLTYQAFSQNFYKNGAFPSGYFEHPRSLNEIAFGRLKNDLKKNYTSMKNAGTPMLLEDGLKFNPVAIKPIDAQLLESKKFQVEDICRVYRVPLHLVQHLDRATNNNIEHQSLEFVMYTMLPHFRRAEAAINTQLLNRQQRDEGYYFEFNISSLLRGDSKSMAEAFAAGRQWGWLSVNDIRKLLNMNPIDNGDRYLEPLNMGEAGAVGVQHDAGIVNEIKALIDKSKGA